MNELTLSGITQRGKNRVREIGKETRWTVIRSADKVGFSTDVGPWLLIKPTADTNSDRMRWVHKLRDKDFNITWL